jgi:hypothetical protein
MSERQARYREAHKSDDKYFAFFCEEIDGIQYNGAPFNMQFSQASKYTPIIQKILQKYSNQYKIKLMKDDDGYQKKYDFAIYVFTKFKH